MKTLVTATLALGAVLAFGAVAPAVANAEDTTNGMTFTDGETPSPAPSVSTTVIPSPTSSTTASPSPTPKPTPTPIISAPDPDILTPFAVNVPEIVGGKSCASSASDITNTATIYDNYLPSKPAVVATYQVTETGNTYTVVVSAHAWYDIKDPSLSDPARVKFVKYPIPRCPAATPAAAAAAAAAVTVKAADPVVAKPTAAVKPVAQTAELANTGATPATPWILFAGVLAVALGFGATIWARKTR